MVVTETFFAFLLVCGFDGCSAHLPPRAVELTFVDCTLAAKEINNHPPTITIQGEKYSVHATCMNAKYRSIFDKKI